jgi:hypothetical protein
MKRIKISKSLCSLFISIGSMNIAFSQTYTLKSEDSDKTFEVGFEHNDAGILPKLEATFSFISVSPLFGCKIRTQYRLDRKNLVGFHAQIPYGKGFQGGEVSSSLSDENKMGYNIRMFYDRKLFSFNRAFERDLAVAHEYVGLNTIKVYKAKLPIDIGRYFGLGGGLELNGKSDEEDVFDGDDVSIDRINQRYTAGYVSFNYWKQRSYSILCNGNSDGKLWKARKVYFDFIGAVSQKADYFLFQFNNNDGGFTTTKISEDNSQIPAINKTNIGWRAGIEWSRNYNTSNMVVVFGFEYGVLPGYTGYEWVGIHAGLGLGSRKMVK